MIGAIPDYGDLADVDHDDHGAPAVAPTACSRQHARVFCLSFELHCIYPQWFCSSLLQVLQLFKPFLYEKSSDDYVDSLTWT